MYLYLVQHAEAMSKDADLSRSLTEKGIEDVKKVAAFASGLNIEVHQILHSGKMRALQTAQLIADYLPPDMGVIGADGLLPMDDPAIWMERLPGMKDNVMLVGHLPYMAKLASLILCGEEKK